MRKNRRNAKGFARFCRAKPFDFSALRTKFIKIFCVLRSIPKAIGAEHIQFHDLRYAFAALSLKNRGGRKTVIWGCRATIRMDPPFAPTPIPQPKRSRALGAPSASRYGKNRRPSICRSCGLSVFRFAGLTFFKTVFSARLPPAPRRTAGTAPALPDQFAHRIPQWGSQADTPR